MAVPRDLVHDAMEAVRCRVKGCVFVVLPTVIQELTNIAEGSDSPKRKLALDALVSAVPRWGFQPLNFVPVGHGIVERIGDNIRAKGLLPEHERNDSFIVAEAALADCRLLISSDRHMLDIDAGRLAALLEMHSVSTPLIVSPGKLVREFFR